MLRQGSDLTKVDTFFFGDLSRSEKLSEIKPTLMLEKGIIFTQNTCVRDTSTV